MGIAPFTHAGGRQEGFLQQLLVLVAAECFALAVRPLPQLHEKQEIRVLVGERLVRLVRLLLLVVGPLTGILGGQGRDNDQRLSQHLLLCSGYQYTP